MFDDRPECSLKKLKNGVMDIYTEVTELLPFFLISAEVDWHYSCLILILKINQNDINIIMFQSISFMKIYFQQKDTFYNTKWAI